MRLLPAILLCIISSQALAIDLLGQTEFVRQLPLNSSISARVEVIKVKVGQLVAPGEVLMTLVSTGFEVEVDIARAKTETLAPTVARMLTEMEKAQELFDRDSLALVALQIAEQNLAIARAGLASAQAELARALFHLSQTEIRSPIRGIVLSITTFPGQYINTRVSDPVLLTIADNSAMVVRALLPLEHWNNSLQERSVRVSIQQQRYKGEVIEVSRQVSTGGNNHSAIELQIKFEASNELPAGLPAKINLSDD